ncbi:MAG: hypothetical protein K8R69_02910 [Deltaproteobacteria bacterium]|nr:hypothetical protein [Deltaproteobacteria bacterium]
MLCKRDNCGDDGKLNDYIFACTQIDPADAPRLGAVAVRIDINEDTRDAAFTRVNDSYPVLEALTALRFDPPPKLIELSACDCLAMIEAKTQCKIEKCPTEIPAQAPAEPPPASDSTPPKAQAPDMPATGNNGQPAISGGSGLCSLGYGDQPNQSTIWACLGLLNGLLLLGWRRRTPMAK